MNDFEQAGLQAELDQITKPGGEFYDRFRSGDKEIAARRTEIFKRMYPEPAPEKAEAENPEPQAVDKKPAENSHAVEFDVAAERQAAEADLKDRFADLYPQKMEAVYQVRDALFSPGDKTSGELLDHLNGYFGNDPRFIALLAEAREKIADLPKQRVDISKMSEKEKNALASQFVTRLMGDLRSPLAKEIFESLGETPNASFLNWAAELGARYYRHAENKKGK